LIGLAHQIPDVPASRMFASQVDRAERILNACLSGQPYRPDRDVFNYEAILIRRRLQEIGA
jgi:hypothetical protein